MFADVRSPPLINRLVVVSNDRHLNRRLRQELDQPLLRRVDVLVLVDEEVSERRRALA